MRYVRLDDEEDRKSVAAVKAAEAKRAKAEKLAIAKFKREQRQAAIEEARRAEAARIEAEEQAEIQRLRESRRQIDTVEIAARKSHSDKNAPSLRDLSRKDEWTPEDLAYVRFYMGSGSRIQRNVGFSRIADFPTISLFGNTFGWNGTRYVKTR